MFVFKACLLRRLQRRKSRLKEVRSQNKFVHRIFVGYLGAGYTSIALGNHPVPVKVQRILLLRLREGVTKRKLKNILTLPIRKQKISQVGFVRLVVIRLEAPGLNVLLLKPAFNKASSDSFRFKRMSALPHAWLRSKVIEWLKRQLL